MSTPAVETCARCGELSAYCWDDCTAYPDGEHTYDPEPGTIAHIGTASCWEWECGHCRANNVERDSPINAECYTHVDPYAEDEE